MTTYLRPVQLLACALLTLAMTYSSAAFADRITDYSWNARMGRCEATWNEGNNGSSYEKISEKECRAKQAGLNQGQEKEKASKDDAKEADSD